ncbi:MAG: hypothetical protein J7L55_04375 [Desulfurococcales archaeon]|nr:hypothetical protein [Desulfurococcales archaeon]
MSKMVKKLVLVTSDGHPQHKYFMRVASEVSKATGLEVETRKDDYTYLDKHGAKDDLGLTWLPQLLVQVGDDAFPILPEPVLTADGKLDYEAGVREALKRLEEVHGRDA